MLLPREARLRSLQARQQSPPSSNSTTIVIIVIVVLVILASLSILLYIYLKAVRRRGGSAKYIPTQYLKRRWENWKPRGLTSPKGSYSTPLQEDLGVPTLHLRSENRSARNSAQLLPGLELGHAGRAAPETATAAGATVDRNTSVRSVMTLPVYSRAAREDEQQRRRKSAETTRWKVYTKSDSSDDKRSQNKTTEDEGEEKREPEATSQPSSASARKA
ncbi:hypothetical protein LTR48_005713 [Friedmanniomyces endolithicus]|uniref:Uncharacterized protein n=1 Tax=Rachicladosporium monterosium TaxID=1507873 RepID=A0ABR0L1A7_9PEZI|nr:hypothetical protein LTR48_005713 [Friedmanniomyces endolithicus]KAK5141912.1 hypothetical protein LTR32_005633 [Rachicladosporium monterosium]